MKQAYKVASLAVQQRFEEQIPGALERLKRIKQKQISVYSGSYDQAGLALEVLGIPFMTDPNKAQMMKSEVVIANCSNKWRTSLTQGAGEFVEKGGLLISSDWALKYVLEKNFPDTVKWNGKNTGTELIGVEPNTDSLWSDVVVLGADPQWSLWGSYPIEVINPEKVKVEAASHELMQRYAESVVAVNFDWGAGEVYHVISHFWATQSNNPTSVHKGDYSTFLREGMRLSEYGIQKVVDESKVKLSEVNFAQLQSAATALELIAQLCVRAVSPEQETEAKAQKGSLLDRLFG